MKRPVSVVPWDAGWPDTYRREAGALRRILDPDTVAVHHIGSTSVPGLCAKPVIDILVEAPDLPTIERATPGLEGLGYEARGEHGIPGRRYFSRPATARAPKVHVHAFRRGDPRAARHLHFRDYLRAHPAVAARYCALKTRLSADHAGDRDAYQAGKDRFVSSVVEDALAWAEGERDAPAAGGLSSTPGRSV